MRVTQSASLTPPLDKQAAQIGEALVRLRQARQVKQSDAALRAGISRATAQRLEHGDPGVALGGILRYLDAIAPGVTLLKLLTGEDPSLVAMEHKLRSQRVRGLTAAELRELDF
ncbi:helix-turn-helix domain-containing protein [Sulfuriferula thiophila]|uniref:helix-turn-helix domain-containing protein n=1 Tax=Sulfuriferula thiophila TaxID=1781211 RepID=UPI000F60C234|nr:helix-turn-helix transcriptional regulator [Sulfuriferula thiophila]